MAAKKKNEQEVAAKKEPKAKAAEPARKAKPAKSAAPKTKTTRPAKAARPAEESKELKTTKEPKTSKLGGLIKRVAKVLPRKKVAAAKSGKETPVKKATTRSRAASSAAQLHAQPAILTEPGAPTMSAAELAVPTPARSAAPKTAETESRLVLMMRDPQTLHAFWTISAADRERYGLDKAGGAPPLLLRLYDRESGNGAAEVYRCQIVVASTERWTVQVPPSGRTWRAEIGFIGRDGQFHAIASSNFVVMQGPPLVMSIQEGTATVPFGEGAEALRQWAATFEMPTFSPLPLMPAGAQPGSLLQPFPIRMEMAQPGSLMGQPGSLMGQPGSQMGAQEKQKGFWLNVATELILYGATVPGSKITVQDVPVELKEDGTFSLRFALPEGFFVFPVHATSPDGDDEREITPVVMRLTQ